jgi:hypothetical protein
MLSAIVIFAYNRPEKTSQLLKSLFAQKGIQNHSVYMFLDGPKNSADKEAQIKIRRTCNEYAIDILIREFNMGLKKNIISGLNFIAKSHASFVVLEDDLILDPNFLDYHSNMLIRFEDDDRIFSISGFSPYLKNVKDGIYLNKRFSSWGWSTWSSKWNKVDFLPNYSPWNILLRLRFLYSVGSDVDKMLLNSLTNLNNSWAILVTYHLFRNKLYSIAPRYSLVENIGFDEFATHTKREPRFSIVYDDLRKAYNTTIVPIPSSAIFYEHRSIYSLMNRLKGKLSR